MIQLLKFDSKNDTREYLYSNSSNVTGQTTTAELDLVNFKASKYGESSYLVKFSDLDVGEYAFFLGEKESRDAYLFSVTE